MDGAQGDGGSGSGSGSGSIGGSEIRGYGRLIQAYSGSGVFAQYSQLMASAGAAAAPGSAAAEWTPDPRSVCPLLRTPPTTVAAALRLVETTRADVVLDLGCGEGVVLLAAAALGARAVGFEVDSAYRACVEAQAAAASAAVAALVEVCDVDIVDASAVRGHERWAEATVVFAYLLPRVLQGALLLLLLLPLPLPLPPPPPPLPC